MNQSERSKFLSENPMVRDYIHCMFWSSYNHDCPDCTPMDCNYDYSDLSDEAFKLCVDDCDAFLKKAHKIPGVTDFFGEDRDSEMMGLMGHNLWLNRNGHGTGFWDEDLFPEALREPLSDLARKMNGLYPFVAKTPEGYDIIEMEGS